MVKGVAGFVVGVIFAVVMLFGLFIVAPLVLLLAMGPAPNPAPIAIPDNGFYRQQQYFVGRPGSPVYTTPPPPSFYNVPAPWREQARRSLVSP